MAKKNNKKTELDGIMTQDHAFVRLTGTNEADLKKAAASAKSKYGKGK